MKTKKTNKTVNTGVEITLLTFFVLIVTLLLQL